MNTHHTTHALPFGQLSTGDNLFLVQPGLPTSLALEHATQMMNCAATLMSEIDDADPHLMRTLNQIALHCVEVSKALLDASAGRAAD